MWDEILFCEKETMEHPSTSSFYRYRKSKVTAKDYYSCYYSFLFDCSTTSYSTSTLSIFILHSDGSAMIR